MSRAARSDAGVEIEPTAQPGELWIRSKELPTDLFRYKIPECIGSIDEGVSFNEEHEIPPPEWIPNDAGGFNCTWTKPGTLQYWIEAVAQDDHARVRLRLKNLSEKTWPETFAFSCLLSIDAPSFSDFDGSRTHLLHEGQWRALTSLERTDSQRPLTQIWVHKPKSLGLSFLQDFSLSTTIGADGSIAGTSWDGKHAFALRTDPPLFVFSNLEFGCVHSCPTFGALGPGEQGLATHTVLVRANTPLDALIPRLAEIAR